MITAAVQTRGRVRSADYAFLGDAPQDPWWRAYGGHTTFEHPTVLVHSDGEVWSAFLSGIPSRRHDAVGTTIRFTLVLGGGSAQAGPVLALVGTWLADLAGDGSAVGDALDAAFPEADVERLLAEPDGVEVRDRVLDAVAGLHATRSPETRRPDEASTDLAGDWLWSVDRAEARTAFLDRAAEFLDGHAGRALLLNLVGSPADLTTLLADPRPLIVLGADLGPTPVPLPRTGTPPGKAQAPSRGTARPIRTAVVVAAMVLATLLATLGTLLWTR